MARKTKYHRFTYTVGADGHITHKPTRPTYGLSARGWAIYCAIWLVISLVTSNWVMLALSAAVLALFTYTAVGDEADYRATSVELERYGHERLED